ncbi:MAG: peptidoglycan DD-metalloendopeptidase family protein [Bacillota bacterium]|nr:peptidoglycan DD-metalloendopeptidase family protein [Bacillota bacterium]
MSKDYIGKKKKSGIIGIITLCLLAFVVTFVISYAIYSGKQTKKPENSTAQKKAQEKRITQQLDDLFGEEEDKINNNSDTAKNDVKSAKKTEDDTEKTVKTEKRNEEQTAKTREDTEETVNTEKKNEEQTAKAGEETVKTGKKSNQYEDEPEATETTQQASKPEDVDVATQPAKTVVPITEGKITKTYGGKPEYSEFYGDWRVHSGVDIEGTKGVEVRAIADGTIIWSYVDPIWGGVIKVDHGGFCSVYMGLSSENLREKGTDVSCGDIIGILDGNILGEDKTTHLHFEMTEAGKSIDPMKYIG